MGPAKHLLRSRLGQDGLAWAAARSIALICRKTRWTTSCPPATRAILEGGRPFIICCWHGRLALMPAVTPPGRRVYALISDHRDGRLIARAVAPLGIDGVPGSSRRGGAGGLNRLRRLLEGGGGGLITMDGPRGPRMRAKPGAVKAAQLSGAVLLPVSAAVRGQRLLGTWDRFCLAPPFSRGVILWGEPIAVPRDADRAALEALRATVEQRVNALTAEADRRCGGALIEPAAARQDHARA